MEYLLEWDVKDAFYDFPFVGNSVTFAKRGSDELDITYDDTLYQQDLEYFDTILASFSIDADQVSEQHIVNNFRKGGLFRQSWILIHSGSWTDMTTG